MGAPGEHVELVIIGDEARFGGGLVVARDDAGLEIQTASDLGIAGGDKVCVRHDGDDAWLYGVVEAVEARAFRLRVDRTTRRDHREFPRMYGAIATRYATAGATSPAAWVDRGDDGGTTWLRPDPFMNFSASGLQFDTAYPAPPATVLLVAMSTPDDETEYRAVAKVVRVDPIPEDERDEHPFEAGEALPTHRMAVHFTLVPAAAITALMAFTERLQRTYLD